MNPYEVYRLDTALRLHFTQDKYDFFKNGTHNRASAPKYFERMTEGEQYVFKRISEMKEPKTYLLGNYIFNKKKYIRSFDEDCYLKFRSCITNGPYILQQDLLYFKKPFGDNFTVEKDSELPYIIGTYMRGKITFFTLCVMEKLTGWTAKSPVNILTQEVLRNTQKSFRFFKIPEKQCKQIILDSYK